MSASATQRGHNQCGLDWGFLVSVYVHWNLRCSRRTGCEEYVMHFTARRTEHDLPRVCCILRRSSRVCSQQCGAGGSRQVWLPIGRWISHAPTVRIAEGTVTVRHCSRPTLTWHRFSLKVTNLSVARAEQSSTARKGITLDISSFIFGHHGHFPDYALQCCHSHYWSTETLWSGCFSPEAINLCLQIVRE